MTSTLDPTFLGLDLSTQQLKAALITQDGTLLHEQSVHFDHDFAHFGTTNGAIRGDEEGEVYCPVVLWINALDLLMDRLKASGKVDFSRIQGIGGAAQVGSNTTANTIFI
jgi:xylulokinase